jgi:hypothetical protein
VGGKEQGGTKGLKNAKSMRKTAKLGWLQEWLDSRVLMCLDVDDLG